MSLGPYTNGWLNASSAASGETSRRKPAQVRGLWTDSSTRPLRGCQSSAISIVPLTRLASSRVSVVLMERLSSGRPAGTGWAPAGRIGRLRNEHAVDEQLDRAGGQAGGVHGVVPGERVELEAVVRDLRVEDRDGRGQAARLDLAGVAADVDRVVAVGAVDDHAVRGTVTCCAAEGSREVDVHVAHTGASQVADGDDVRAAECVEVHALDVVRVHGDRRDVTEEPEPVPVGGQVDVLRGTCAVEDHPVEAGLALDRVAAVA